MGNLSAQSSSSLTPLPALHQNWIPAPDPAPAFPQASVNLHRTRLLLNTVTLDYIEQYTLYFPSEQEYTHYLKQTEWRKQCMQKQPSAYFPPVRYFTNPSTHSQLCSRSYTLNVYFDRTDLRLQNINDIPYSDGLYMLRRCLEGFRLLSERFGYFGVMEDMVYIDEEGEVRVWISGNVSAVKVDAAEVYVGRTDNESANSRSRNREGRGRVSLLQPGPRENIRVNKSNPKLYRNPEIYVQRTQIEDLHQRSYSQSENQQLKTSDNNQQSMVKEIIALIEDNMDMETLPKRKDFQTFSKFISDSLRNQPNNRPYEASRGGSQKFKTNAKPGYRFEYILQLYNKYVQSYQLVVPRRMEVIHEICKNTKNTTPHPERASREEEVVYLDVNKGKRSQNNGPMNAEIKSSWKNAGNELVIGLGRYDESNVIDINHKLQKQQKQTESNHKKVSSAHYEEQSLKIIEPRNQSGTRTYLYATSRADEKPKEEQPKYPMYNFPIKMRDPNFNKPRRMATEGADSQIPPMRTPHYIQHNAINKSSNNTTPFTGYQHNSAYNSLNNSQTNINVRGQQLNTSGKYESGRPEVRLSVGKPLPEENYNSRGNKFQSPLSTLLEEQAGPRLVRTNQNTQMTPSQNKNIKFNFRSNNPPDPFQVKYKNYQPESTNPTKNILLTPEVTNIKYVRTPLKNNPLLNEKPNSVNITPTNQMTAAQRQDHGSLNKVTKILKPPANIQINFQSGPGTDVRNGQAYGRNQGKGAPRLGLAEKEPARQANLKYYTSNDTYQLDSQIANDLKRIYPNAQH